ncbi:MAG: hypothetical protein IKO93_10100, partial [Lentisphaeria bacterium]|nr:hypothetical protein [Lentisphaeria bacterium]
VKPCFPAKLKEFKAEYRGYSCEWKQDDEKILLNIAVPAHSKAFAVIPGRERLTLKEGNHNFVITR